jgi:hypothetical protein
LVEESKDEEVKSTLGKRNPGTSQKEPRTRQPNSSDKKRDNKKDEKKKK